MRLYKSYLLVFALCFLALYGCKKSSSSPAVNASVAFQVDGVAKSTNTITTTNTQSPAKLQVLATFSTGEKLYFTINNPKVGTFDVSSGAATITYAIDTTALHIYNGATGSVVLNTYTSSSASGTFQFTGRNVTAAATQITEGTFQSNY